MAEQHADAMPAPAGPPAPGGPPPGDPAATGAPAPAAASGPLRWSYAALWRAVPAEAGFLILTLPVATVGLIVTAALFFTGLGTLAIVIGLFLIVAGLYTARGFGSLELVRLDHAGTGRDPIERPLWEAAYPDASGWRRVLGPFVDGHYWLYLLHTLVVGPIVSTFSWVVAVAWVSTALGGVTAWLWNWIGDPYGRTNGFVGLLADLGVRLPLDGLVVENLLQLITGLVLVALAPLAFRALVLLHRVVARGMLGRWRSERLEEQVVRLDASRGAAIRAEDAALRRLERDIHDGPQQRLIRLQMDLAAAERRLATDPDAARVLLEEARGQTAEALEELRALSRGVAPPLLQDRGLAVALDALAARAAVPVIVDQRARDEVLPPALERNAYFIAAELLTNAAKHSDANAVRLTTATRTDVYGQRWLDVWVGDNGHGGAHAEPGHGLAGLAERTDGLGGVLVIDSPAGGPTNVGAHLPIEGERRSATDGGTDR